MPVWLRNLQSIVRFREHLLRLQCNFLLHLVAPGACRYDVSVVCLESEGIRNLNRTYRNLDQATDVLAFPYHEVYSIPCMQASKVVCYIQETEAGSLPYVEHDKEHDYNLGDVILGMSVIGEQCASDGVSIEHRLPVIVTHGLCHLLGYRHDTPTYAEEVRVT